eukprot:TRINITY_DN60622_c0_g1_i2.p1 TRINITY_DN60622_c0_g1~~TRINITY_DN60622_c0_g1_i2.p1  ORF type:complete len:120 (-),score=10.95 TRINITY_DN60622_c0_g1_i2:6-365(-)
MVKSATYAVDAHRHRFYGGKRLRDDTHPGRLAIAAAAAAEESLTAAPREQSDGSAVTRTRPVQLGRRMNGKGPLYIDLDIVAPLTEETREQLKGLGWRVHHAQHELHQQAIPQASQKTQ